MQELTAVLVAKHDADYQLKKFQAALKGVDLDAQNTPNNEEPQDFQSFAEKTLAKRSGESADDVLSLKGEAAQKLGFGIGMGLDYELIE